MHRHWSLYESMQYSSYLVVNFHMWKGFKRLEVFQFRCHLYFSPNFATFSTFLVLCRVQSHFQELFAKMGISQQEYMQQFAMVHSDVKDRLDQKFLSYGAEFSIEDIRFPSFVKVCRLVL